MRILVTDGVGYIGGRTCMELLNLGHEVVVVDNLYNSSEESPNRVEKIIGKRPVFYRVGLLNKEGLEAVLAKETVDTATRSAGLKVVGKSVVKPLEYYHNNITGTLILRDATRNHDVERVIFSPSVTIYGDLAFMPITENCPKGKITNPYGQTKGMLEQILTDLHMADPKWSVILLCYFNPAGVHRSGLIGGDPAGTPNNSTSYITQVAVGKLKEMGVLGDDYDTPNGTGVRDHIHVVDLATGHVKVLDKLMGNNAARTYNLGTGRGYNALDMIKAFSKTYGKEIPYVIRPRRPGDMATCHADPALAKKEFGWEAERGFEEIREDGWRWQSNNPNGYRQQIVNEVVATYC